MTESGPEYLANIPASVVIAAQNDLDFAVRLLHRETREEALNHPGLGLTEGERGQLFSLLDDIASMSFQSAIEQLRGAGVAYLG